MTVVQSLLDDWHNELGEMDKERGERNIQLAQYYGPRRADTLLLGLLRRRRGRVTVGPETSGQGNKWGERLLVLYI